ncbi:MAG: MFS transporter, partial [Thermodesulfobacteriota bacterium]|nr:MFS transporter [Thermodesulfobacteriota bacterium]
LIMISGPVLGGIADYTQRKKSFLMVFCYSGSLITTLFVLSGPGDVFFTLLLFCLAYYCFAGGNIFYDAYLPLLSRGKDMDRLSGQGYALGYMGGGLLLCLNLLFIRFSQEIGVCAGTATRLSLASAGIWWGVFGTISFSLFHEERARYSRQRSLLRAAFAGMKKAFVTTMMVARHREILIFLLAYMIYNDGVHTVITMASIYGKDELHLSTGTLLGTLLMVQFTAIGGSLLMSRVARSFGSKKTIMGILILWFGVTIFAYGMKTCLEYWILGLIVGLILGGTQALSRSFYGCLIPRDEAAQYFGYFSAFAKFSAIWGPILFAIIRQVTGTSRLSILSLSSFFMIGFVLVSFVHEKE